MIRETKINLERDEMYVDERLCGVNDMTLSGLHDKVLWWVSR